jgi:hypothetical protein
MVKEKLKWLPIIGIAFGLKWFHANDSIKTFLWEIYQYISIAVIFWFIS